MKTYLLVTTLTLASIVAVSYWTGKRSAQAGFANACATLGVVVVFDRQTDAARLFHCFEFGNTAAPDIPEMATPRDRHGPGRILHL